MQHIRAELRKLAHDLPEIRGVVVPLTKSAAKWETLPKGWTDESVSKFWETLTGDNKHKVTKCIKEMSKGDKNIDDPGAFCAALADKVMGPEWRKKKASTFLTAPINSPQSKPVTFDLHKIEVEREFNSAYYWVELGGVHESWVVGELGSKLPTFGFNLETIRRRGEEYLRLEWRQPEINLLSGEALSKREFSGWARKMEKAVRDQIKVINREIKGGRKTNVKKASARRVAARFIQTAAKSVKP